MTRPNLSCPVCSSHNLVRTCVQVVEPSPDGYRSSMTTIERGKVTTSPLQQCGGFIFIDFSCSDCGRTSLLSISGALVEWVGPARIEISEVSA